MSENNSIFIKGARINNLKNIDVEIPRDKLVVITGLSGSGKSSLAFDTLYAEGQRRYVESLSAYARQFLGRMSKPECDYIKGIPPAIAIEQKVNTRNPRSTVGTSTEIYEYLRLLYARIGKTISPVSGIEVKKHQVSDIVKEVLGYPAGTRFAVYAPVVLPDGRGIKEQLEILQKEGYTRLSIGETVYRIGEVLADDTLLSSPVIELLIDRLVVSDDKTLKSRLADSAETAFFEGHDTCIIRIYTSEGTVVKEYSKKFEADGMVFEEPTDMMFSFNNPLGACPTCEGFGKVLGIDENLVVPDKSLSVFQGAVVCWKGDVMGEWLKEFIVKSEKYNFPIHRPYYDLTQKEKDLLWHGARGLHGIDDFFKFVEENLYKIQYRVMLARYRGKTVCPTCKGSRLRPEALYVKVGGKDIAELVTLPITEAKAFFDNLRLDENEASIAKRLLTEITNRLQFLLDVGLGYLTLDRLSASLSGGESQRINLATSLGSSLVGSLYILDEPSIGLHSRDTDLLIKVLRQLQALGNTVVVVEHDEDTIRHADYVIDMGPGAGEKGGHVVAAGTPDEVASAEGSFTADYLSGRRRIEVPEVRRKPKRGAIKLTGACENNLKNVSISVELGTLTVVTGVSGSGKSSLITDTLAPALANRINHARHRTGEYRKLTGYEALDKIVDIDQSPIGRTPRSNPATYIGLWDDIRALFASTQEAKARGYAPGRFSFNVSGGRCEACKGDGQIKIEMHFLPDVYVPCEVCGGMRYNRETLQVTYRGKNVYDVLDMTVDEALEFFKNLPGLARKLQTLHDVGLGYIRLGQPATTLSGGEAQRVKLASELQRRQTGKTFYVLDEPTTGLHMEDVRQLLDVLQRLVDAGNTVLVIEHNLDVIKTADRLIDLGPEGGSRGGTIVATGTPEQVAKVPESHTGRFLRDILNV